MAPPQPFFPRSVSQKIHHYLNDRVATEDGTTPVPVYHAVAVQNREIASVQELLDGVGV